MYVYSFTVAPLHCCTTGIILLDNNNIRMCTVSLLHRCTVAQQVLAMYSFTGYYLTIKLLLLLLYIIVHACMYFQSLLDHCAYTIKI